MALNRGLPILERLLPNGLEPLGFLGPRGLGNNSYQVRPGFVESCKKSCWDLPAILQTRKKEFCPRLATYNLILPSYCEI